MKKDCCLTMSIIDNILMVGMSIIENGGGYIGEGKISDADGTDVLHPAVLEK